MKLSINNISRNFGQKPVLQDISFELEKGYICGVLGPNGAGKTTLMKIISGLLNADEGDVSLHDKSIKEDLAYFKSNIGFLPEHNPLYNWMYVKEFLSLKQKYYSLNKSKIDEVIELLGLEDFTKHKISELSKGYKQRVGIANVLLHDPSVLILDEATSGLDPLQITEIQNIILQLGKDRIILFSSHILSEVKSICSRILMINEGKLIKDEWLSKKPTDNSTTLIVQLSSVLPKEAIQHIKTNFGEVAIKDKDLAIKTTDISELKKYIQNICYTNQITIDSLNEKTLNLEDIFTDISKKRV